MKRIASCLILWTAAAAAFAVSDEAAELIARPTGLIAETGAPHHPVTTESETAQAFYNQGLGWTHSYFWIEAARSFRQALDADPDLALAHVGMAIAYRQLGDIDLGRKSLDKALELKEKVSDRERGYIEARDTQWRADRARGDERKELMAEYRSALTRLVEAHPWDAELWAARGQASEANPRGIGQRGRIEAAAWYEGALAQNPNHIGALHYLTHCYENTGNYVLAVDRAEKFADRALAAPHAQHMAGHVLPRAGRWEDAVARFARAHALETAYFEREQVPPTVEWHHAHNMHLYGMALMRMGREEQARAIFERAMRLKGGTGAARRYWEFLIHFRHFEELQEAASAWEGDRPLAEAYAVEGLLLDGKIEEARRRIEAYEKEGKAESRLELMKAKAGLFSDDAKTRAESAETLMEHARKMASKNNFDGWGDGLFHITRMARMARAAGDDALLEQLRAELRRVDPEYDPLR